eukprot:TRINITY_DN257_c0_g1_i2.p1 TRINITY_DN257_c0_g1~~TRINITY_DN257_c0_g1_i2.p1  ORF type:complete len:667 (-),score=211.37 TRINITY_DN257_c0_g1_i2:53-2053(-)
MKQRLGLSFFTVALASAGSEEPKNPAGQVVNLLQDLKAKIEKDGEVDDKDYEKYKCWCQDVQASKAAFIEEQTKKIERLSVEIEDGHLQDKKLEVEIEEVEKEEKANVQSSKDGTKNRQGAASQRLKEKKVNEDTLVGLHTVEQTLKGNPSAGGGRSNMVLGMISDQYTTTADEEETSSKVEAKAQANYDGWLTDMKAELGLLQTTEREKKTEEAHTEEEVADDTEMKDDTEEQKKADKAFLKEAEQSCADRAREYNERSQLRLVELGGVNKALEILDANREKFVKPSFLQIESHSSGSGFFTGALEAFNSLKAAVTRSESHRLALVSQRLKTTDTSSGAAKDILKTIDQLMETVRAEGVADTKKKDHCIEEYYKIAKKSKQLGFLVERSAVHIDKLSKRTESLNADLAKTVEELGGVEKDVSEITGFRKQENAVYLSNKADNQMAIEVLKETHAALEEYYKKHADTKPAALIQYDPSKLSKDRKDLKQKEHKYTLTDKNEEKGASDAILSLIDRVSDNLKNEMETAKQAEEKAQSEFEAQEKTLLTTKKALERKSTGISNMKVEALEKQQVEETTRDTSERELMTESQYKESIQKDCDWIISKFDLRVKRREAEMEGLSNARTLAGLINADSASSVDSSGSFVQHMATEADVQKHGSLMHYLLGR